MFKIASLVVLAVGFAMAHGQAEATTVKRVAVKVTAPKPIVVNPVCPPRVLPSRN